MDNLKLKQTAKSYARNVITSIIEIEIIDLQGKGIPREQVSLLNIGENGREFKGLVLQEMKKLLEKINE